MPMAICAIIVFGSVHTENVWLEVDMLDVTHAQTQTVVLLLHNLYAVGTH